MPSQQPKSDGVENLDLSADDEAIFDGIEADIRAAGGWQNFDPLAPSTLSPTTDVSPPAQPPTV